MDNNFILVVVDKLSKMAHYIATHTNITAEGVAKLILKHIVRYHGMPSSIVSDRDTRFHIIILARIMETIRDKIKYEYCISS